MALGARVILGIPTLSSNPRTPEWIDGMANLQLPLGSSLGRVWVKDKPIAEARNEICRVALGTEGCRYLVMLGDDVFAPPNMILQMLGKIGREYPTEGGRVERASMVTGVYWTKTEPTEPYLWNGLLDGSYRDWTVGEFFPLDWAGCDALMIEVEALRRLPYPWFSTDWVWEPEQAPSAIATEDAYFYWKARAHGVRLFADTAIQCLHEDRTTGRLYGLTTDMPQMGGVGEFGDAELVVADIGAGDDAPYWGPRVRVVRFDGRAEVRPDVRCDLAAIPAQYAGTFDVVHSRHVLEHFGRAEQERVVAHWASLLKPDGRLILRVPNIGWALDVLAEARAHPGTVDPARQQYAWMQLYGGQTNAYDYHRYGFLPETLTNLLRRVPGLADVDVTVEDDGQNLKATARLVAQPQREALTDFIEQARARETPAELECAV